MIRNRYTYESPLGPVTIEDDGDGNIVGLFISLDRSGGTVSETDAIRDAWRQVREYLDGTRREFDVRLAPEGTEFQRRVWKELCRIPYGETRTYKDLAAAAGSPRGARAVGTAMNRNPISIIQPCHRVIGSDGGMTGFASGIDVKMRLLRLEGALE